MAISRALIHLLEGVHCSAEVLTWTRRCSLAGFGCQLYAPGPPAGWIGSRLGPLDPPRNGIDNEETGWPAEEWGYINSFNRVTIETLGLTLLDEPPSVDEELVVFDDVILRTKTLLRDWLVVLAEGPTDFLSPSEGISWITADLQQRQLYHRYRSGAIYEPDCAVSRWQWEHAMEHALKGEPAPLSHKLIALAKRDAVIGDGRNAVIHAATAAEHALTIGLSEALSRLYYRAEVDAILAKTRMLGRRLRLAQELGLEVPAKTQADLVEPRNAAVHGGSDIGIKDAMAAVEVGCAIVRALAPLPSHCYEPEVWQGIAP